MALSNDTVFRMCVALTKQDAGNELASAVNNGSASASQDAWPTPAAIVAAHTSATTDFGALLVGDLVIHVPATAGNAQFGAVVTAGTLPFASAVVGDLYVVLRAFVAPSASAFSF